MSRLGLLLVVLLLSCGVALSGWLDRPARALNDAALQRALVTFAVARTLNGVISMAQGTEVAVQPAGMGINFAPGQLLDPVNDLVESFSTVMLYASVALGTQKLLLAIGSGLWLSLLLVGGTAIWFWLRQRGSPATGTAARLLLAVWVLRFAVPLVTVGTEAAFNAFLQPEYQRSAEELDRSAIQLGTLSRNEQAQAEADEGFFDRASRWLDSASAALDVSARMAELQAAATTAIGNMIDLIVVFLLQTVAIPIGLLWFGWRLIRRSVL